VKLVAPLEVGIAVADLDRMRAFYEGVIGLEFVSLYEVPPDRGREATMCDAGYRIARLQAHTGERIKLAEPNASPERAGGPGDAVLARRGPAFLTFIVEDLDATIASLLEYGVEVRTGPAKVEVRDGVYLAFAVDPEGNFLEFVEYEDVGAYRPDLYAGR
jgi:catechol 2,3-dioxygenase-like lactoylglutathione lyase family enzyme